MDSSIFKKAGELLSRKSKYRHWQAIVAVLGVAVIGTTAIVLSQPAQTMTKETYCGMEEHVHTAECYQRVLICGLEEEGLVEVEEGGAYSGEAGQPLETTESPAETLQPTPEATQAPEKEAHQHNDSCYEEYLVLDCQEAEAPIHQLGCYAGAGMLICGQEESADHIHTDECYDAVPVKALACGQEESEVHTHSEDGEDSCYIIVGAKRLGCGVEESEEHIHTDECYELIPAENFQCMEGHTHTEACYPQETESPLICGMEEQEAHTHTEECYTVTQKQELTCGQEESDTHKHTDDCYQTVEEEELTCGMEETEGHTHTEQCYSQDGEKAPICGREETQAPAADAHVHTIACCRTENKLICGKEEYIPEESVQPEATPESTVTPEATAAPESADSQESTAAESSEGSEGAVSTDSSAAPETTPESSPASQESTAAPEATPESSTTPEGTASPESTAKPEVSGQPEAGAESSTAPAEEGKHVHTDACYEMRLVCGLEEHAHTDDCYREAYCGIPAHVHMPGCYDEEGNVICGKEEHIHEGNCYKEPHCGITAHTHKPECFDENGELICGMEEHTHGDECFVEEDTYTGPFHCQEKIHQHTADCYDEENNLICGMADYVVHAHNDSCYDEEGELICPLPEIEEHAHSAQCYDIPGEGEEAQLACGKEEAKLHTHTEDCYDEEGKLTCGMLQVEEHVHNEACLTATEEVHVHTESCYDEAGNLICGYEEAHTHTEECYDEEGKLICGFGEETEELPYYCAEYVHEHSEECYDENQNLICGKADFAAHVHTEDCYNKVGELVCPLPEIEAHTHSAACYSEANGQLEAELICGKTEDIKLHTHTEECYDADGKLICGKLEVLEHVHSDACHVKPEAVEDITYYCQEMVHEHSEDCYNENGELICGEADYVVHTHTEKCYGADEKLICPLPEVEAHIHTPECYTMDVSQSTDAVQSAEEQSEEDGLPAEGGPVTEVGNTTATGTEPLCGMKEIQLHTHTESCYDENGELICGQTEVLEHIHSKDCEVSHKPITKTFQGENFVVTATYRPEANIPEEAELIAEQITAESNEEHYAKRQAEYQEALGDDKATMRALLKIGFYVNGEEVEPESPVTIKVQFLNEDGLAEGKPITVIHFADEGTELLEGSKVEDGSTTFEMNSFSEIAVGYGVENVKVPVNEELKYETDEFQVTFKIEGEVRVPVGDTKLQEEEGAEGEAAVPGDSTEGEVAQGEENTVDNPEAEAQTGEGGVSVSIENSNLEKKLEFRVDPVNENAEEYAKAVQSVYADGTIKTEEETSIENGTQLENETKAEDEIQTEDGSQPEEGMGAGEDIEAAEPEIDMGGDQLFLQVLSYGILYDGQKLDLSDCVVTVEVTPSQALVEYAETALDPATLGLEEGETIANELEVKPEVVLTAVGLKEDENEGTLLDAMVVNQNAMSTPMAFTINNDTATVAFYATSQADAIFMVQYYAYLNIIAKGENAPDGITKAGELEVIDTSGGVLPQNGSMPSITKIFLADTGETIASGNGNTQTRHKVVSTKELTEVYAEGDVNGDPYHYVTAPGLTYFDKLADNGNYDLAQIWILKPNHDSKSINKDDWWVYTFCGSEEDNCGANNKGYVHTPDGKLQKLHFTNKQETSDAITEEDLFIKIENDTVIRLVYDTNQKEESNPTQFYDYDISDGNIYNKAERDKKNIATRGGNKATPEGSTWYMYTEKQGINNDNNYSERTGTHFAFGNGNTKTTLGFETWNNNGCENELNRGNDQVERQYKGLTFKIAKSLKTDGTIRYNDGVAVPNLFNESGQPIGKSFYNGSIKFRQEGDTYTMTSVEVGNKSFDKLDMFNHPAAWSIWTNNFWPMDYVDSAGTDTHDLMFGTPHTSTKKTTTFSTTDYQNSIFHKPKEAGGGVRNKTENTPQADDYTNHNPYFGMYYTVDFELTADYVGPLEYLFYGDDDMWVFLSPTEDGNITGEGQLICDIGGVHSSVGEYVNLWDWIKKGEEGSYRLSFFYTERGASGSSCWMQFTLPSVSFSTPERSTGNLRVDKKVTGTENDDEFGFKIVLKDKDGVQLKDNYSYSRFKADGTKIKDDVLIWDGGSFELKAGEYVEISFLPLGTQYEITEIGPVVMEEVVDSETGKKVRQPKRDENGNYIRDENADHYHAGATGEGTTNSSSAGADPEDKRIVTGTISKTQSQYTIQYTNEYIQEFKLPETGGFGTTPYTVAGTTIVLLGGAGLMYRKKFRERRG